MDAALFEEIFTRLETADLKPGVVDTVLAACDSKEELEKLLNDAGFESPEKPPASAAANNPKGAYLTSLSVEGFRGIGPKVTVDVSPGPGLTVVVGRNGSGKSSIAEGVEVLLTGEMRRLENKPVVWKKGWRNLHGGTKSELRATLAVEGEVPNELVRTWSAGADLEEGVATVQAKGSPVQPYSALGWEVGLRQFRPILAHAELEAFFGKPTEIHEVLSSVLGLQQIEEVQRLLSEARRTSEKEVRESKAALPSILEQLEALEDERAASCLVQLKVTKRDLGAILAVVSSSTTPEAGSNLSSLEQLAAISLHTEEEVDEAVASLDAAILAADALKGTDADAADRTAKVLRAALAHYEAHGRGDCPVCGTADMLDEAWAASTLEMATKLELDAKSVRDAGRRLATAATAVRRLIEPVPAWLADLSQDDPDVSRDGPDVSAAAAAWSIWSTSDVEALDPAKFVEHVRASWGALASAVGELTLAAKEELKAKHEAWAPVAADVTKWCQNEQRVQARAAHVANIKAAETWLKEANEALLNDRMEPIQDAALRHWEMLRQGSDVSLTKIHLEGTANRRTVEFDVEVDGTASAALGVMSQGEINALALSVFIPRATAPESPFRFVVIDDPIQAMDPSKVDGFARVLEELSASRQVLVFTHDHRLTDAIRRLRISAHVLDVTRKAKSSVAVERVLDPVSRSLAEAEHVARDTAVADAVKRRVVGGLCRMAIEAHLVEMARGRLFGAGHGVDHVDAEVARADSTNKKAALGLLGDVTRGGDVLSELNRVQGWVATYFKKVRDSAHVPVNDDIETFLRDARDFVKKVA